MMISFEARLNDNFMSLVACQALFNQDDFRFRLLDIEYEHAGATYQQLIEMTVKYLLDHGYAVIVEGNFRKKPNRKFLQTLIDYADQSWLYYIKLSFEETWRRHQSRPKANAPWSDMLQKWYVADDSLGHATEQIIDESSSLEQVVDQILADTQL